MGKIRINYRRKPLYMRRDRREMYVPRLESYSTIAMDNLIDYACKAAHVPRSVMYMSMEAMYDAISYFVINGHSVQVPNIGTFSLVVNSHASTEQAQTASDLSLAMRAVRLRFTPCVRLKNVLYEVHFERRVVG